MKKTTSENTQRGHKVPNYAQAAKATPAKTQSQQQHYKQQQQQQQQQEETNSLKNSSAGSASNAHHHHKNFKNKEYHHNSTTNNTNNNDYKKAPVQLPVQPPSTDTVSIQFGSIKQSPSKTPPPQQPSTNTTRDTQVFRSSEAQFTNSSDNNTRPRIHNNQNKEIPRSPRTPDSRLFTQAYAPRRDQNQGDNSNNNNGRYYKNNSNTNSSHHPHPHPHPHHHNNNNNNYGKQSPYQQTYHNQHSIPHHPPPIHHQQQPPQPPPQQYYQTSPPPPPSLQQQQQQQQQHHHHQQQSMPSPNFQQQQLQHHPHQHHAKKITNSPSPQLPNNWNPPSPYFISTPPTYQIPVYVPPSRSPVSKAIPIVNPLTKTTLNFDPTQLPDVMDEKVEFKIPDAASKAVNIVDPTSKESKENEEVIKNGEEKVQKEKEGGENKNENRIEHNEKEKEVEKEEVRDKKEIDKVIKRIEEDELKRLEEEEEAKKKEEQINAQKVGMVPPPSIDTSSIQLQQSHLTQSPAVITNLEKDKLVTSTSSISSSTSSILHVRRKIEDPSVIEYPSNISSAPTTSVKETGRFVYSPEFLRQFEALCQETSEDLSVIKRATSIVNMNDTNMARRPSSSNRGPNTPVSGGGGGGGGGHFQSSIGGGGDPMFRLNSREGSNGNRMEMGKFNMGRPLIPRSQSIDNNNNMITMNGQQQQQQQFSAIQIQQQKTPSGRGRGGGGGMKIFRNPSQNIQGGPTIPLDQVAPLEKSENRWVPTLSSAAPTAVKEGELIPQNVITRKVNALLNKLTLEKFDSIAQQIFDYAHQSAKEEDGKSLRTVIKLLFAKACDEPAFATMWGKLCSHLYQKMTDDIRDVNIIENDKPVCGSTLFRKYLFSRCQQEFERGWKMNMPTTENQDALLTDEYYAAAKAKRQGLGLIQFVGEMYKLHMLSDSVMKSCIVKLTEDPENACDEEVESLCKFITTVGKNLEKKEESRKWVAFIIHLMTNVIPKSPNVTNRVKFMMLDVIDLRKNGWVGRNNGDAVGPTTIAKIHEMAEKAKDEKEAAMKRNNSSRGQYIPNQNNNNNKQSNPMARTGSYRGNRDYNSNNNNNSSNGDGWNTVGSNMSSGGPNNNNKNRMNDLSNFGKTDRSRTRPNVLGPSNSPFPSLNKVKTLNGVDNRDSGEGRASPATNMFSALLNSQDDERQIDNKPEERKKLVLKPRSVTDSQSTEKKTEKLTDDVIKRKSKNILEEYFSIRDKRELSECIKELDDSHYREIFVEEMLSVVEKKASDVDDMSDVATYLCNEKLLDKTVTLAAFKRFMETYDDLTIDVPQAHKYVAKLLVSFNVSPSEIGGDEFPALQEAYDEIKAN